MHVHVRKQCGKKRGRTYLAIHADAPIAAGEYVHPSAEARAVIHVVAVHSVVLTHNLPRAGLEPASLGGRMASARKPGAERDVHAPTTSVNGMDAGFIPKKLARKTGKVDKWRNSEQGWRASQRMTLDWTGAGGG
jgi:hypothetical protein